MSNAEKPKPLREPKPHTSPPPPPQTLKSKKLRRTLASVIEQMGKVSKAVELASRQLESLTAKHKEISRLIEAAENPGG